MFRRLGLVAACLLSFPTTAAAQGGPDAYGYSWDTAVYDFVALAGGLGTDLVLADDGEATVALPFSFAFYDGTYTDLIVGANGGVRFTTASQVAFTNACLPDVGAQTVDIAAYWDDLNPSQGGAVYTYDDAANGRFIVSWEGVPHYLNVGAASVQLHLYDTGEIQVHWDDTDFGEPLLDNGVSATVGIQDAAGGNADPLGWALQVSCNAATVVDGTAVSFECLAADDDGDGVGCGDCDDTDDTVYPGAVEVCDGIDQNCDGQLDDGFVDGDGDGVMGCIDCDDADATAYPGAPELCDGIDNDCNGLDDAGDPGVGGVETDDDGDLIVECAGDCDDLDITVFPGALEVCGDATDNDCSGVVDDAAVTWTGDGGGTPIPDGALLDQSFTASVDYSSPIADVDVSIDIEHTGDSNLDITLHSPLGTSVELTSDNGGAGDDYLGTIFDDEAATAIQSGSAPFTGSFIPEGSLSDFDGEDALGDWLLQVVDDFPDADDGELLGWSVTLTVDGDIDDDGDGFTLCEGDCDDDDDTLNPGETDVCDGIDNDCSGLADEAFTDDDGDGAAGCVDCDDTDDQVFPGALELCNGIDDDCNGLDDAGFPGVDDSEQDDDGDGLAECDGDCDDGDDLVSPLIAEICADGIDNDCSGLADQGNIELTGAGIGTPIPDGANNTIEVDATTAFATTVHDLDVTIDITHAWAGDLDVTLRSPAGTEVELTSDNGGNGDDYTDTTFDDEAAAEITTGVAPFTGTFQPEGDLSDFDGEDIAGTWQLVVTDDFPAADDGVLNSWTLSFTVDGTPDDDGDGVSICAGDCDDSDDTTFPGNPEVCDGSDNDCDGVADQGFTDGDGDGAMDCVDCDDADAASFPGAVELCDGADNDCDGLLDAGLPDVDGQETDDDGDGVSECEGDCDDDDDTAVPGGTEVCDDGVDNDCDPATDETTDEDGDGESECDGDCDDENDAVSGSLPEVCDQLDNDCDSAIDEDFDADNDGAFSEADCAGQYGLLDCDDGDEDVFPDALEDCDADDDNCNGQIDEDLVLADGAGAGTLISDTLAPQQFEVEITGPAFVLDVDVVLSIDHTWDSDLDVYLFSPSGTSVSLTTDNGGAGDGYFETVFDDDAADPVQSGSAPFTGSYQPEGSLASLIGEDAEGIWILQVTDDFIADDGELLGWQLRLSVEGDGDGVVQCDDCDDDDPNSFPGGVEVCDGLDNDCNGASDFGGAPELDGDGDLSFDCEDCDDNDLANFPGNVEICDGQDNDCDATTVETADGDGDGLTVCDADCDDDDPDSYPGAPELCDGVDNDCDGQANFGGLDELDLDEDGSYDCEDCDDEEPAAFPGNPELCDGIDNDCDATTNEAIDGDGDTFSACVGDCDDFDDTIYPGAVEICDAADTDCDGDLPPDESDDIDGDGFVACLDCDDEDDTVHPDAIEACDGVDNDCDPSTDELVDGDGDLLSLCGGDCDDDDPTISPVAVELCDGIDNDCDETTDETVDNDGDGLAACDGDCDDGDPAISPSAAEICDGVDNDCDDVLGADELDEDGDGVTACDDDCDDDDPDSYPGAPELCDGLDNDCDGSTGDEELDVDGDGLAPCDGDCDDALADTYPDAPELCDGLDNDCDDEVPADEADADGDGAPVCAGDCDDADAAASPDGFEDDADLCADGIDNDCDGDVDEDDADCADVGDDDDSADDDDDATDDDDAADDDDSAGDDTGDCDCASSLAGAAPSGTLAVLLLLGLAGGVRRRR